MNSLKNKKVKIGALALAGAMAVATVGCSTGNSGGTAQAAAEKASPLDPANPTTVTVWNYYNGDQLAAFDALVAEFNASVGMDRGIVVNSVSQGSIDNLAEGLLDAVDGKVGAQDVPDLASVYAETAYILNESDALAEIEPYFTEEELAAYIPGFIEAGRLVEDGPLMLFPVSKSTECFAVNDTDWAPFEEATGIAADSITDVESLVQAAKAYYEWTDSLTDTPNDGKALYGRDSLSNYLYVGAAQLGHEYFVVSKDGVTTDLDHDTIKTLWDNFYIPYINGWFGAEANYRSEDMKTGTVLAVTSSTSGVSYLPTAVTDANDATHDITLTVRRPLGFAKGTKIDVQQGADYCVLKSDETRQYAAVTFLKWFTEKDRNLKFSATSGYSPVTVAANTAENITAQFPNAQGNTKEQNMLAALLVGADVYSNMDTYTCKPFAGSKEARDAIGNLFTDACANDRAAVEEALAGGASLEDAVAPYSTDEYFDTWYNDTFCPAVNALVK